MAKQSIAFDDFWKAWLGMGGKSNNKKKCKIRYNSLSKGIKEKIQIALENQHLERQLMRKHGARFIPMLKYPYTWLNGDCWEDETRTEQEIIDEINSQHTISSPHRAGAAFIWGE